MAKNKESAQLETLEGELAIRLRSYHPRTEYVRHLKNRLVKPAGVEVERSNWKPAVLLISLGIVGFIFATIGLLRYIWSFFSEDESADDAGERGD
jgi:hypothetical protein